MAEDIRPGLAVGLEADPDGEASDVVLVPGLPARTRAVVAGPRVGVGDRLFCGVVHWPQLAADGAHFVVRYNAKAGSRRDADMPVKTGVNGRGQAYTQEWGWRDGATGRRRLSARRVTGRRPGDEDVSVGTDRLDDDASPAGVLDMYRRRRGIERLFRKVTEVFRLRTPVSSSARGTVFQAARCLPLYNLTVVIRVPVAAGAGRPTAAASPEKLFGDVCRQRTGLTEVLGAPAVAAPGADGKWPAGRRRKYSDELLGGAWRDGQTTSPPRQKGPPTPTEYWKGGHSSAHKIVRGLHGTVPERKKPPRPAKDLQSSRFLTCPMPPR